MEGDFYTPDNWIVLRMTDLENRTACKLLGGWSGGYLSGNSWRMNSGIIKITEPDKSHWDFHGYSGSVYRCHKDMNGIRMNIAGILTRLMEKYPNRIEVVENVTLDLDLGDLEWAKD